MKRSDNMKKYEIGMYGGKFLPLHKGHNYCIDVATEEYFVDVKMYAGKICWVMPHTTEIFYSVVAAHIPSDMMGMIYNNLGDSRCPATTTDYRYFSTIVHTNTY